MEKSYKRYTALTPDGDMVHKRRNKVLIMVSIEAGAEAVISLASDNLLEGFQNGTGSGVIEMDSLVKNHLEYSNNPSIENIRTKKSHNIGIDRRET